MSLTLDPSRLPLWGSRLIEASAGTGKTWTIAALYLRLVLGHGDADAQGAPSAFTRPLAPAEILVMTFTRAATRELSDRIRARLLEAARCFRGKAEPEGGDPFLAQLLAAYPEGAARTAAAWRLAAAAESMDDASVHTIDAWCQRMLREHAFDSGCLFDETLSANETAMLVEAAQDYWRQQLYPLHGSALDTALGVWPDIGKLTRDARALVQLPQAAALVGQRAEGASLGALIGAVTAERAAALGRLKDGWGQRAQEMRVWIDAQMARKPCPFDGRRMAARHYAGWLDALAAWSTDPQAHMPDMKTGLTRFTPEGMQGALKDGVVLEPPAQFAQFGALMQALAALPPPATPLRLHATAHIAQRLAELKRQSGSFGFADMLARLNDALDPALNGEAAARLRARMLAQYPVAMVDEFQDTSPVQASIFDRLYRIADNDPASGLLLIGDPKQSIYGFRGADIHSYLAARRATAGRHYALGTNHRSTASVVAAVNHLLSHPEERSGEGAFMYRRTAGGSASASAAGSAAAADNPLPFLPVEARGRGEAFVTAAGEVPAMTLALDAQLVNGDTSRRHFAARCAERIAGLLNDPAAGFAHPHQPFERLRPADIAVLVRTGKEAAAVQHELRRRRIASVYLSDKESVFASPEAQDLLRWLQAVASPLDVRLARAAFATRTAGLSLAELLVLARDDEAFDARSEQLRLLHGVWRQQGVLTMLRRTLHLLGLPARWLAGDAAGAGADAGESAGGRGGERRLTNVLHLAELLQAASTQLDGEQALIRWLSAQMQAADGGGEEQVVRLESDADLVKVITVHKAKGLEYPLVFLPFASSFRAAKKTNTPFVQLAGDDGEHVLHLHVDDAHIAAADKDRHREDLRLLYVALTRARHAVWVGLAALREGNSAASTTHRSAIGYVLHGPEQVLPGDLMAQIEALVAARSREIALVAADDAGTLACTPLQPRGAPPALRDAAPYAGEFDRDWSIGSFSALVRALPAASAWASSVAAVRDDEAQAVGESDASGAAEAAAWGEPSRATGGSGPGPGGSATAPTTPAPATASILATVATTVVATTALEPGAAPWHTFPRGATPGNFLHDQLEWLAGDGFDLARVPERQAQLLRRCERQGWGHRADDVLAWLVKVVGTPLPPLDASLDMLQASVPEMEFWLPSDGVDAARLDALCRAHLLPGRDRPALPQRALHGMVMGFADLVFAHGGRYWVLDYKSNHLASTSAGYTQSALEAAMAAHRYDVQATIYLLALHRLLRARLGAEYVPAQHLGGAVYLFLRGIDGPAAGCCHLPAPLPMLAELDALLAGGDGVPA